MLDFEWTGTTEHGAGWQMAIAHDAVVSGGVTQVLELAQHLGDFKLQGALEKLPGAPAYQLVQRRGWTLQGRV